MEFCWETGGPDWLFEVVLWAAFIGVAGFLMWLPIPDGEQVEESETRPRALRWALPAALVLVIAFEVGTGDVGVSDIVWGIASGIGAIIAISAIAFVLYRAPRLGRWFLLTVWVGSAAAALGAVAAMNYLGHRC